MRNVEFIFVIMGMRNQNVSLADEMRKCKYCTDSTCLLTLHIMLRCSQPWT